MRIGMIRLIGSEITMALQCFNLGKLEFVEDGDFGQNLELCYVKFLGLYSRIVFGLGNWILFSIKSLTLNTLCPLYFILRIPS